MPALFTRTARHFSPGVRRAASQRAAGNCECGCGLPLVPPRIRYDHRIPWAISHDSSLANCQVLRLDCDAEKTYRRDLTDIAKVRAVTDKHLGIKGPGLGAHPMAGGRKAKSPWKRKVGGGLKPRTTQVAEHARVMAGRFGGMAR